MIKITGKRKKVSKKKLNKIKPKIKSKIKPKIKQKVTYNQKDAEIRRIINPAKNYYSINIPSRFADQLEFSKGDPILVRVIGVKLVVKKL